MKRARVESSLITDIKSVGNLEEKGGFLHRTLLFIIYFYYYNSISTTK